uniref:Uncharacterized protein n=1 Tax=Bemisia tabaci TaxID=7038 RepID=A0A9P0ALQ0_BEMTA|nr:unnamed protein product [Bemisia tabaci]
MCSDVIGILCFCFGASLAAEPSSRRENGDFSSANFVHLGRAAKIVQLAKLKQCLSECEAEDTNFDSSSSSSECRNTSGMEDIVSSPTQIQLKRRKVATSVKVLKQQVPHNIICKTARGLVDLAFSDELKREYLLKGQKRLNVRKRAFVATKYYSSIIMRSRGFPDELDRMPKSAEIATTALKPFESAICTDIHGTGNITKRVNDTLKSHLSPNLNDSIGNDDEEELTVVNPQAAIKQQKESISKVDNRSPPRTLLNKNSSRTSVNLPTEHDNTEYDYVAVSGRSAAGNMFKKCWDNAVKLTVGRKTVSVSEAELDQPCKRGKPGNDEFTEFTNVKKVEVVSLDNDDCVSSEEEAEENRNNSEAHLSNGVIDNSSSKKGNEGGSSERGTEKHTSKKETAQEADSSEELTPPERPKQSCTKNRPIPELTRQPVPQVPLIFSEEIILDENESEKMQSPSPKAVKAKKTTKHREKVGEAELKSLVFGYSLPLQQLVRKICELFCSDVITEKYKDEGQKRGRSSGNITRQGEWKRKKRAAEQKTNFYGESESSIASSSATVNSSVIALESDDDEPSFSGTLSSTPQKQSGLQHVQADCSFFNVSSFSNFPDDTCNSTFHDSDTNSVTIAPGEGFNEYTEVALATGADEFVDDVFLEAESDAFDLQSFDDPVTYCLFSGDDFDEDEEVFLDADDGNSRNDEQREIEELNEEEVFAAFCEGLKEASAPDVDPLSNLKTFLREWSLERCTPLNSLTHLLHGLKSEHPECFDSLPSDARTIMNTPTDKLDPVDVPPGKYIHLENLADCTCGTDKGTVILVQNFIYDEELDTKFVVGRRYLQKYNLFAEPGSKPTKDSANPNEGLVEDLWTLVFNLEEDEYDVFSNNWIQDDKEIEQGVFNAKYPPENFNANVLAKKGQQYADNWKTVTVKLIEKNYQSFEQAFTDMVRLTKGHRLKRDSDAELANSKRKRIMTKSIEDFFAGSSKKGKEPKHKKKPVLTEIPKFPVDTVNPKTPDARKKSTPKFHTPEDLSAVESTSSTKDRIHAESPPKRAHEKSSKNKHSSQSFSSPQKDRIHAESPPKRAHEQSSKDKHSSQSLSSPQKDRIHAESPPKRAHEKSSKDKHSSQSLSKPQQKVDSTPKDMSCEASGGYIMGKFTSSPKTTKLKIKDGTEKRKFFGEFTDEESTTLRKLVQYITTKGHSYDVYYVMRGNRKEFRPDQFALTFTSTPVHLTCFRLIKMKKTQTGYTYQLPSSLDKKTRSHIERGMLTFNGVYDNPNWNIVIKDTSNPSRKTGKKRTPVPEKIDECLSPLDPNTPGLIVLTTKAYREVPQTTKSPIHPREY